MLNRLNDLLHIPQIEEYGDGMADRRGINRRRWKAIRIKVLERDRCRKCGRAGRLECDYVLPVAAGESKYDLWNLQALYGRCHISKSRAENRKRQERITPLGSGWRRLVDELL